MRKTQAKPSVYSYTRLSTPEQRKGSGKARQTKLAKEWLDKNKLQLCQNYSDLGVSAYKGKNATEGQLSAIIKCIESGKIKRNDILLIESLDRLSRDSVRKAAELFLGIVNRGVRVVTLCDEMEYSDEKCELPELMLSLMIFARSNDESKMKSQRKAGSWNLKREAALNSGAVLGGKTPRWIMVVNKKYQLIEHEAEIIRSMFKDYVAGIGIFLLSKKYNVPKPTISYWLNNPVVIGTLRMTDDGKAVDVPNHYPAVIDAATWKKSQQKKAERYISRKQGRVGSVNLFSGLLVDHRQHRFDVARYAEFPCYISPNGVILQCHYLERVIIAEKLANKFVTTRYTETLNESPKLKGITAKIKQVQQAMVEDSSMIGDLLPVMQNLKNHRKEIEKQQEVVVSESVDYSLVIDLLVNKPDQQARMRLREICRETIKQVKIDSVQTAGNGWYILVKGTILLNSGTYEKFSYAYCTRRVGYLMTDGSGMTVSWKWDEEKNSEAVERPASVPIPVKCDKINEELIEALKQFPMRRDWNTN